MKAMPWLTEFLPRAVVVFGVMSAVIPGAVAQQGVAASQGRELPAGAGLQGALPPMSVLGGEERWKASACATAAPCSVLYGDADKVDSSIAPRLGGGAQEYDSAAVTSRTAPVASLGFLGGGLAFTSQNGNRYPEGYAVNLSSLLTHRETQSQDAFVLRSTQMYGDNAHYLQNAFLGNRDNMVLLNLVSDMAGGQLGGTLGLTGHHYGNGDTIGVVSDLHGWGINMGDEEGTSLFRGTLGPVVNRFVTTVSAPPVRNLNTAVFDLPVTASNVNFLGIHNFLLNTTNTVSLNVASLNQCTTVYGICLTPEKASEVVRRYGTTRFQAIHITSTGMLTVESVPQPGEELQVNGKSFRLVAKAAAPEDVAIGAVPDETAANLAETVRRVLPGVAFQQHGPDLVFTAAGVTVRGSMHVKAAGAGVVLAVSPSEFLPSPKLVTVTVADSSACKLHSTAVLFDSLIYQLVTITAVNSPTSVTLASFDNYNDGATLACGGAAGYAFTFDADVIPAADLPKQYGVPFPGNATIYNRMHPAVGNREDGTIVLWSSMTADYSTRALARNAPLNVPAIHLATKGGAVTGGAIDQKGDEYKNVSSPMKDSRRLFTQAVYLPLPQVKFSAGCTAVAHVQYWTERSLLMVGTPDAAKGGGTSAIIVDKPGTGCDGATATLTASYDNPGKLYPLAMLESFRWKETGTSYAPDPASMIVNLVAEKDWRKGDGVTNEIGAHTKTNLTSGLLVYDYSDGGNNQQYGSSGKFFFSGVTPRKFLWGIYNFDNPALFAEPNTVATTSAHFKMPPNGLTVSGSFATTLQLSAPVGWGYSATSGAATLIQVDTAGHTAAANQVAYNLFSLPDVKGQPVNVVFNPTTRAVRYPLLESETLVLTGTAAPAVPVAGAVYYDAKADRPAACGVNGCGDLAMRGEVMRFVGTVKTTAAAADSLAVPGLAGGHCNAQQVWDGASQPMAAMVEVAAGKVVLHHPAVAGAVFDVSCVGQ